MMLVLGEVYAVMEKFYVYNDVRCLRNRTKLFQGIGMCVQSVMIEMLRGL